MSLKRRTLRNLGAYSIGQLLATTITQVTMVLLATMIDPANFGIYSLLFVMYTLALNTSTAGIDYAAIQSKDDEKTVLITSSSLRLLWTAVAIVAVISFSPLISEFFQQPALLLPLVVLAISLVVPALGFMSLIQLNRDLRFPQLSVSRIAYAITWSAISLTVAVLFSSYWALVIALIAGNVVVTAIVLYYAPHRIVFHIDKDIAIRLMRFAKFPMMAGLITFMFFNFDKFIVGSIVGEEPLGAYFLAFTWGTMMPNIFTNIVNSVMMPTYVKINQDIGTLARTYLKTLEYLAYVAAPIGFGVASISSMFVATVLGPEWTAAIIPLAILSFVGLLLSITSPAGSIFLATGNPNRTWRMTAVLYLPGVLLMIPAAMYFGVNGVAATILIINFIASLWVLKMATDILKEPMKSVGKSLWRPFVAASVMAIIITLLSTLLTTRLLNLLILIAVGAIVYSVMIVALTKGGIISETKSLIQTMLSRKEGG